MSPDNSVRPTPSLRDTRLEEWQAVHHALPMPLQHAVAELVARDALALTTLFYDTLLDDPEAAPLLSHEIVTTHLSQAMQRWLVALFPVGQEADFHTLAEMQRKVGAVHARIALPVHLVMRGGRILRGGISRGLQSAALSREDLARSIDYVSNVLDIALELMTSAFIRNTQHASRNEEAFRLFSLGQDVTLEREGQRAALAEWLQSVLFALAAGQKSATLPRIRSAEFGLWVQHRCSLILGDVPEMDRVNRLMQSIDLEILPHLGDPAQNEALLQRLRAATDEIKYVISDALQSLSRLESGRDPLTRTLNRRFLPSVLAKEVALAAREHHALSALMIDLDHFKAMNDRYGHPGGDVILSRAADIIADSVRLGDFVFRYGGEEFFVLLPETTPDEAMMIAERMRSSIAGADFQVTNGQVVRITASIGVVGYDGHPDYARFIEAADRALYDAKNSGRNRVYLAR